jgi:hypothetical protein
MRNIHPCWLGVLFVQACGPAPEGGAKKAPQIELEDPPVPTSVGSSNGVSPTERPGIELEPRGASDADGDGYSMFYDCRDRDPTVYPGAFEYAGDGVLNDCGEWSAAGHAEATRVLTARDAYFNFSVDVGFDIHPRRPFPVGDINGDGYQDLGVGTMDEVQDWPQLDGLGMISWYPIGGFFLFLGPIAPQPDPELFFQRTDMEGVAGIRPGRPSGTVLVPLGDLDTDGFDDFLVSATGNTSYSELFLVMGPADIVSLADAPVVFLDDVRGSCLGCQPFATGSDLSGDGIPDVVGAAHDDSRVIGWSGDALDVDGGLWPVHFEIVDPHSEPAPRESRFGQVVNSSCDLTADGLPELVVGAPRAPLGDPSGPTGKVFIFEAPLEGVLTADAAVPALTQGGDLAEMEDSNFGHAVSCGDSDGDGHADLLVGAPYHASSVSDLRQPGAALLFLGPVLVSGAEPEVSAVFEGSYIRQQVGTTVSVHTDFDGDGGLDVIIGTTFFDVEGAGAGVTGPTNETALFLSPHAGVRTFNRADIVFRPDPLEASGAYIYDSFDWTGDASVDLILGASREWFGIFENPYR